MFLFAGYDSQTTSFFGIDVDLERFNIGGGYAWSIGPSADVYGKFAYLQEEVGAGGVDADNYGYLLGIGLRGRIAEQLELECGLNYAELLFSGAETSTALGARWFFAERFTAGVEGEFGDTSSTYGVGVRWDFGK